MDTKLRRLLKMAVTALDELQVDYAIGGAMAMAAHDYIRETRDVDVFALEEDQDRIAFALRRMGLRVVPVAAPYHLAAYLPNERDPERRIDLLFPAGDPELSAIELPDRRTIEGVAANVFPLSLLVIAKFYANRPKDDLDIEHMLTRGLFDPAEVHRILLGFDEDGARGFVKLIRKLRQRGHRPRPIGRRKT